MLSRLHPHRHALVAALMLGSNAGVTGQPGPQLVPPIPAYEQFVHGANLRIRLTMRSASLATTEDPGFTLVFENTGRVPATLNPHVVPNLRVFDARGDLMQPSCASIGEPSGAVTLRRHEFVHIGAGATWAVPISPAFVSAGPDTIHTYRGCGPSVAQDRWNLPPGSYSARFTYLSYAGHTAGYRPGGVGSYDLREAADVWEGRLESNLVTFTVVGSPDAVSGPMAAPGVSGDIGPAWPPVPGNPAFDCAARRPEPSFSEEAIYAAGHCGTAETFEQLRPMIDAADEDLRFAARYALANLTFTDGNSSEELGYPRSAAAWDAWYRDHRGESRDEWAAQRLREPAPSPLQREAARYLVARREQRWLPLLRDTAATHPSAWVRIAAAAGVADSDRAFAIACLKRELTHRDLWINAAALHALNTLSGRTGTFDFRVPSQRQLAIDTFASVR